MKRLKVTAWVVVILLVLSHFFIYPLVFDLRVGAERTVTLQVCEGKRLRQLELEVGLLRQRLIYAESALDKLKEDNDSTRKKTKNRLVLK